ncbi:MAG: response regulator [Bdellovibrionota bacterium]
MKILRKVNTEIASTKTHTPSILIVDDDQFMVTLIETHLTNEKYQVFSTSSVEEAIEILCNEKIDILLTDLKIPGSSGLTLLDQVNREFPSTMSIIMTAYGTLDSSINALRKNAADYILKPFEMEDLSQTIERTLKKKEIQEEYERLRNTLNSIGKPTSNRPADLMEDTMLTIDQLLEPDHVFMLYYDQNQYRFLPWECKNLTLSSKSLFSLEINIDAHIKCFQTRKLIKLHGDELNAFYTPGSLSETVKCALAIPFQSQKALYGFFVLFFDRDYEWKNEYLRLASILTSNCAQKIENIFLTRKLQNNMIETVESLLRSLQMKDQTTSKHSDRVKDFARMMLEGLQISQEEKEVILHAAVLHDIGKMAIDLSTLNTVDPLDERQMELLKQHPIRAKEILSPLSCFSDIVPIIYHHHERFDGTGYPDGLKADQIPLGSRIICIADSFESMTSDKVYRKALSIDMAKKELMEHRGTQFDPHLVDIFFKQLEKYSIS